MNRKILLAIASVLTLAGVITVIVASGRKEIEHHEEKVFRLNDTLTNEMSDIPELQGLDRKIRSYLRKWHMKGASLAITRGDSLVYAKGYGWADAENGIEMSPRHILRMASVSKLITAAGIMVLHDRGDLNIKDTVFGPSGILNDSIFN